MSDIVIADSSQFDTVKASSSRRQSSQLTRVFDADLTRIIGDAFDAVWAEVVKDPRYSPAELEFARGHLAERIIELAQKGEVDPARLREEGCALFHLVQAAQVQAAKAVKAGTSSAAIALSSHGAPGDNRP